MAWSPWMHKAYAAYDEAEKRRKARNLAAGGVSPVTILGASLLAWWTADRSDLITLNGSAVTSWKDVVAGYDAVQGVSAARPIYSATSFNGAPGLTFDGIDDELTLGPVTGIFPTGADPSELWAIAQQDILAAAGGTNYIVSYGSGATVARRIRRDVSGGVNRGGATVGLGGTSTSARDLTVDLSSRHVLRAAFGATTTAIEVDSSTPTDVAAIPATAGNRFRIGASDASSGANFWQGKARDVLVTLPLSAAQVTALEAWALPRRML